MKSLFIWNKYYTRTLYADVLLRPSMVQSKTGPLEDVVISFLLIQWSLEEKHYKKKKIRGQKSYCQPQPLMHDLFAGENRIPHKNYQCNMFKSFFLDLTEKLGPIS